MKNKKKVRVIEIEPGIYCIEGIGYSNGKLSFSELIGLTYEEIKKLEEKWEYLDDEFSDALNEVTEEEGKHKPNKKRF